MIIGFLEIHLATAAFKGYSLNSLESDSNSCVSLRCAMRGLGRLRPCLLALGAAPFAVPKRTGKAEPNSRSQVTSNN